MTELEFNDQRHLEAAEGWIEFGNQIEANEELENITPENRSHPAVLEVRWQIYAKAKKGDAALEIASALIQLVPKLPLGWAHRSYSLHELKRNRSAAPTGRSNALPGWPEGRTKSVTTE
jgi:hypothetical protein